jgi:hypothetical protein
LCAFRETNPDARLPKKHPLFYSTKAKNTKVAQLNTVSPSTVYPTSWFVLSTAELVPNTWTEFAVFKPVPWPTFCFIWFHIPGTNLYLWILLHSDLIPKLVPVTTDCCMPQAALTEKALKKRLVKVAKQALKVKLAADEAAKTQAEKDAGYGQSPQDPGKSLKPAAAALPKAKARPKKKPKAAQKKAPAKKKAAEEEEEQEMSEDEDDDDDDDDVLGLTDRSEDDDDADQAHAALLVKLAADEAAKTQGEKDAGHGQSPQDPGKSLKPTAAALPKAKAQQKKKPKAAQKKAPAKKKVAEAEEEQEMIEDEDDDDDDDDVLGLTYRSEDDDDADQAHAEGGKDNDTADSTAEEEPHEPRQTGTQPKIQA